MGRRIEGDALTSLGRALGLTGSGVSVTELQDATLEQVIDVQPIVRRSRTLAGTEGIITGSLVAIHAGAGTILVFLNPYAVAAADIVAPYPTPLPVEFELWLLAASVVRASGTGTFNGTLEIATNLSGFGRDSTGAATAGGPIIVASWGSAVSRGNQTIGLVDGGGSMAPIGLRLPRMGGFGQLLMFRSTASALATFACNMQLGVFPIALGQDAQV